MNNDGELIKAFDDLYASSSKRTLMPARLGARQNGVTSVAVPGNPNELYISLGPNGEQGPNTAVDAVGVDTSVLWQQIWVRRELNKWVIHRASVTAGGGGGPGSTTLDGLTDVDTAGAADGDLLAYDSATGEWIAFTPTGTTGTAPSPHALDSAHHSGTLADTQAPQFLMVDGSRPLTGNLAVATSMTIDGVDISAHAGDPNAHHPAVTVGNGLEIISGQLLAVDLEGTTSGLEFNPTTNGDLRVKKGNGITTDATGTRILFKPGMTAITADGTGLYLDNSIAGTGLAIDGTTKVLSVKVGEGLRLDVPNDEVEVDKGHNFIWTGTHQFNALTTFNNNIHFMGGDRIVTATNTLTLNPATDLWLDPGGIIIMPTVQTYRTFLFNDFVAGIEGFVNEHTTSNKRYLRIAKIKADELHVRVFTADEQRVSRGAEFWARSFGILEEDILSLPAIGATVDAWFEEAPDLGNFALFIPNNWLEFRTIDVSTGLITQNVWFQVVDGDATGTNNYVARENQTAAGVQPSHVARQKWRLIRRGGGITNMPVRKGNVGVEFGLPLDYVGSLYIGQFKGQGVVHLSALDEDDGPFVQTQIFETASGGLPQFSNRVRMGNLKNTLDYTTNVYGFAAGDNLAAVPAGDYSSFRGIAADAVNGLRLFNTDIYLYEGSTVDLSLTSESGLRLKQDVSDLGTERRILSWHDNPSTDDDPVSRISSWTSAGGNNFSVLADSKGAATEALLQLIAREPSGEGSIRLYSGTQATSEPGGFIRLQAANTTIWSNLVVDASPPGVSSSSAVLRVTQNNTVTGAGAGVLIEQRDSTNVGDAVLRWWLSVPNRYYSMGIDNSDGDKFKITSGPSLASPAIFTFDPIANVVTIPGISTGGGGTGVVSLAEGEGITIVGTDPAVISVNADVARSDIQIIAGAGLGGGGDLTANRTININPGAGLEIGAGDTVAINLHATAPGLNTTAGLQLDATVAGDGLEFVGTTRVMQASLGNGLVFTGTTPARDVTIKLRSISTVSSGLTVDTDGLYIRRRGDNGSESGLSMNTSEGLYIADGVAGDGLEWVDSPTRVMKVSLGIGLEFTGANMDVRIKAPPNSGLLRDDTGVYLNPTLAGDGLLMAPGTGVIDIVPSATGGLVVGVDSIGIKRRTTSPGSGLNITADGLHIQRRGSAEATSGFAMSVADGIWLADGVAGAGLEWTDAPNRIMQVTVGGGLEFSSGTASAAVRVDLAYNYPWTANHTFGTAGLFRVDSVAQFNNNINFMGARTVLSTGNLTFSPTGNMVLSPTGSLTFDPGTNVLLPQAQTLQTVVATDNPTGIRGVTIFERSDIANYRQMNIGAFKADELYVRVFVADETRIDRGEEFWSKGFGVVQEDTPALPVVGATFDVWFENAVSFAGNIFGANDWLLFRTIDFPGGGLTVQAIWCQATTFLTADATNNRQRWRLTRRQGGTTGQQIKRGNVALNMGLSGQGAVHLSALVQDNGPFIQFGSWRGTNPYTPFTGEDEPFTNYVRIGKLTGTVDYGSTVAWGLVTGNNVGATPEGGFSGLTADNLNGLRLFNTALNMYSGGEKIISLNEDNGLNFLHADGDTYTIERSIAWVTNVDSPNITTGRYSVIGSYHHGSGATDNILKLRSQSNTSTAELRIEVSGSANGNSSIDMLGSQITVNAFKFRVFADLVAGASGLRMEDSAGTLGLFLAPGGAVGIGRTPVAGVQLHVNGSVMSPTIQGTTANNGNIVIEGTSSAVKSSSYVLLQPTGGLVGIGIDTPVMQLHVAADGASAALMAQVNGGGPAVASSLILYTTNGTQASPQATLAGDLIGQISFQGWDNARSIGATIRAYAAANWGTAGSGTDDPTNLSFWTVPDGSQTQFERMTILSSGNVGIQNPEPAFVLDVAGTLNATGAVTFGSSLAIAGALTGVTTLTAATITGNTTLISNTLTARTAVGLSITDDGGVLGIFVDDGGGVAVANPSVPAGVQLYVGGLGVIRALTDVRSPLFRAVGATGLRVEDDGGNLGIEVADGGAVTIPTLNTTSFTVATSTATTALVSNVLKARTVAGLSLQDDGGNEGIAIADGGAVTVGSSLTATTLLISNVMRARTAAGLRLENDGGALGIFVADDGLVGINNASPTFPLHISDTRGSGTGSIVFGANVSSSYTLVFGLDDTGFKMGHNSSSRNLEFQTANLTRMTIGGTGNVSVGSSTLTAKFNIEDTAGTLEHLWIRSNGNAPTIHLRRANASGGVLSGDVIGQIAASGRYDSSSFSAAARGLIRFVAKANWNSTSQDTGILFLVTSGSSPVTAGVFEILPNGTLISTGTYGNAPNLSLFPRPVSIDSSGLLSSTNTWTGGSLTHSQSRPVWVNPDGVIGNYNPHAKTSSGGIALLVNSSGEYGTTTSALRFKANIEDVEPTLAERIVTGLRAITYTGKDDPAHLRQYGFIAEEVHALGAAELVAYDGHEEPYSLHYERFIVPLIATVQRLMKRVDELERKLN